MFGDAKGPPVGPSRGAILAAMIARLESTNFSCVGCGYPLRGIKSPVCPECARRIRPYEVLIHQRKPMGAAAKAAVMLASLAAFFTLLMAMRR